MQKCKRNMWVVLEVTHEGTNDVKRARNNALIQMNQLRKYKRDSKILSATL